MTRNARNETTLTLTPPTPPYRVSREHLIQTLADAAAAPITAALEVLKKSRLFMFILGRIGCSPCRCRLRFVPTRSTQFHLVAPMPPELLYSSRAANANSLLDQPKGTLTNSCIRRVNP